MTDTPTTPRELGYIGCGADDYAYFLDVYINNDNRHVEIPIYRSDDFNVELGAEEVIRPRLVLDFTLDQARGLANLLDHALMHIDDADEFFRNEGRA